MSDSGTESAASPDATSNSREALTQLRALTTLRLALVIGAVLLLAVRPDAIGVPAGVVLVGVTVYAVITTVVTLTQRWWRRSSAPVTALLLVDAAGLVALIAATGGASSPIVFIALLHLVAASLLVSPGTAVRLGAWYALLLLVAYEMLQQGTISAPSEPLEWNLPAAALVFVAFAIGCSLVALASDRASMHTRDYFRELAVLSTELEHESTTDGVMVVLGRHLTRNLSFRRAVVVTLPIAGEREVMAAQVDEDHQASILCFPMVLTGRPVERVATEGVQLRRVEEGELAEIVDRFLPFAYNVMVMPLVASGEAMGLVLAEWAPTRSARLPRDVYDAAVQCTAHASLVLRNSRLRDEIEQLATRDALTGLPNRRVLSGTIERELARARRHDAPLGLVILDLDHFKLVNDTNGHAIGDRVLREVADGLADAARGEDLVARYGGEEFVVLLPGVDPSLLEQTTDRIRILAGEAATTRHVTLSAGAACFPHDANDEAALFDAADLALYRAKRSGRDQTQVSAVARSRAGGAALAALSSERSGDDGDSTAPSSRSPLRRTRTAS